MVEKYISRGFSKHQMEAYCTKPCKWRCYGSAINPGGHFAIKVLEEPHTCTLAVNNKQMTATWIAQKYLNVFRFRPEITIKELCVRILSIDMIVLHCLGSYTKPWINMKKESKSAYEDLLNSVRPSLTLML